MTVQWKKVHVFISSTFSDMHAERDYLVKRVFPELQDWCERRKLRLVDVDLRWGVTEEDATENKNVVDTCLNRIDECRPFFVCLLGQRYGWTPDRDDVSQKTLDDYPGLKSAIDAGASVTELEILHAIVSPFHAGQEPDGDGEGYRPAEHTFFYLRDDSYLDGVPDDPPQLRRRIYTDRGTDDATERQRKLHALRHGIIPETGRPVHHYRARWDPGARTPEIALPLECPALLEDNVIRWQNKWQEALRLEQPVSGREIPPDHLPEAQAYNERLTRGRLVDFRVNGRLLHEVVLADLKKAIARRFPEHVEIQEKEAEDDLQRELNQHEEFLFTNSQGFIERGDDFAALDDYVRGDSRVLFVLTAPGGMGKSMLLAKWIDRCRKQRDDYPDTTFHPRFVGQSDGSNTVAGLLRYLLRELQEVTGKIPKTTTDRRAAPGGRKTEVEVPLEIPADPQELRGFWRQQLAEIGKDGKTVIVIDALNQLETGLRDLTWLPISGLPENVKLVVSFRRGAEEAEALYETLNRNEHVHLSEVAPFDNKEDRRKLVDAYLRQYLKELDKEHVDQLISARGACNPLFIKVVLSELRVFGAFEQLRDKIESDFGETPVSAFEAVLQRLERDPAYTPVPPDDGVPFLFGLLLHARHGLSAQELGALFVDNLELTDGQREDAQEAVYLFLRQVKPFLARREGRYDFFYESFERAVRKRYVVDGPEEALPTRPATGWHGLLADYFAERPLCLEDDPGRRPNRRKLAELPYQQANAHWWKRVQSTLTDFDFLQAKISGVNLEALLEDYPTAADAGYEGEDLPLVEEALRLSAHVLAEDVGQLAGQLLGRLMREETPSIRALMHQARGWDGAPWLRPLRPTLRGPGSPLLRTLDVGSAVTSVAVTPDGRLGLSGSEDHVVRVWDPRSGVCLHRLKGHTKSVRTLALTREGRYALSGSSDRTVRVWDLLTRECVKVLRVGNPPNAMAVSPDGQLVVTGGSDETVTLWDRETGERLRTIRGDGTAGPSRTTSKGVRTRSFTRYRNPEPIGTIWALTMTPDDQFVVAGSSRHLKHRVRIWRLDNGKRVHALAGHKGEIWSLAATPDGQYVVSGSADGTIRVWHLRSGKCVKVLTGHRGGVRSLAMSQEGQRLISGGSDKTVRIWSLASGLCISTLPAHSYWVLSIAVAGDGRLALSGSQDRTVRVWDLDRARQTEQREVDRHRGEVWDVAFTSDGRFGLSGADDATLRVWDAQSGEGIGVLRGHEGAVYAVAPVPDGDAAVSASRDGTVRIWDVKGQRELQVLDGEGTSIGHLATTPDGRYAVSGDVIPTSSTVGQPTIGTAKSYDLRVWDLQAGSCAHVLKGHRGPINALALTPDGQQVLSASADRTLQLWDVQTGARLRTLKGHTGEVRRVDISPDGRLALSASGDSTLRLWDLRRRRCLQVLDGHTDAILSVKITPDGRMALSGGRDRTIRLWDLRAGTLLRTFDGHRGMVGALAITPDGLYGVSGSEDHTVRVWNLAGGDQVAALYADRVVDSLAYRNDRIIFGDDRGHVHLVRMRGFRAGLPFVTARPPQAQGTGLWGRRGMVARCPSCGERFRVRRRHARFILDQLESAGLRQAQSRCLHLPREAWDRPELRAKCRRCGRPLRFNPFIADGRGISGRTNEPHRHRR